MDWPKITIVTPSYNQGAFLEKTIQSVLDQNYPNLEYFVVDGGSDDNSVDVIKKYEKHLDYWVSEPDKGQSHAINKGLSRASGTLLGWLNSDDYFLDDALEHLATAYLEDETVGVVYGQGHIVDESARITYTPKLTQVTLESLYAWCYGNDFMQPSCLFTKKAWEACGPLDEKVHIALDVDLWLKIAKNYRFKKINAVLSHSLTHEGAKTTAFRGLMTVDLAMVINKHGGEAGARRILEGQAKAMSDAQFFMHIFNDNVFLRIVRRYVKWKIAQQDGETPHWK